MTFFNKITQVQNAYHIVDVTPEIASRILRDANFNNRKVKPSVVNKYADIMAAGEWMFAPEPLCISTTGRLLQGQHRLMAIVSSGVTCRFAFATGFSDAVFKVLDRGAGRTVADALGIEKKLSEVGNLLARIAVGRPTDFDIDRAVSLVEAAHDKVLDAASSHVRVFSSAPFRLACAARIMGGANADYCLSLYGKLVSSDIDNLPPLGCAAIKNLIAGKFNTGGGKGQENMLSSAWYIFDQSKAHMTRMHKPDINLVKAEILEATGYSG